MAFGLRGGIISTLCLKEVREVVRDRRTLLLTLGLPAIIYPVLFSVLAELGAYATVSLRARPLTVALAVSVPQDVEQAIRAEKQVTVTAAEHPQDEVREARAHVGLTQPAATADGGTSAADPSLVLYFDATSDESRMALERVEEVLSKVRQARLTARLATLGVAESYIRPLPQVRQNVALDERMRAYGASRLLPFLLIILSLVGAQATSVDITAGERERGTLLTLMSAPVRPAEVAAAKLITVAAVAMASGLVNLLSVGMTLSAVTSKATEGFALTPRVVWGCTVALVPTALYGAALLLGLSAMGRTTKEAQAATAPALFLCLGLAAVAVVPGVSSTGLLGALPVAGPSLLMRDLLMSTATAGQALTVGISSLVTLWLMVAFAARVLTSEPMLSTQVDSSAVMEDIRGERRPTGLTAALVASTLLGITTYLAPWLQGRDLTSGLALTLTALALSGALWLRLLRLPVAQVMAVRLPATRASMSGLLFGLSVGVPLLLLESVITDLAGLTDAVTELQKAFDKVLPADLTVGGAALLLGVLPGVMEELAFRGALQGVLLAIMPARPAIILQAVVFGLAHQSLLRFPPTFLLGTLMGVLRWRSGSVWPGALMHAVHNALMSAIMVAGPRGDPQAAEELSGELFQHPALWVVLAAALLSACVMAWRLPPPAAARP